MNAGRLAEELGVAPHALSFHLRVLKGAGLIRDQRHGQFIRYGLSAGAAEDLVRAVVEHLGAARTSKKTPPPEAGEAPAVASQRADGVDEVGQATAEETAEEADDVTLL